jgi:conjugal transfer mating pair stabilization protein TraG
MAFEIWTVGGGYFLYDVFNYLAAIAGHPDLRHMLYIALMATMLFLGMRLALFGSFREVLYWMIAVALVGGLSTAPRARVIIMDTTQPLQIYGTVDNVPFAPAYIGHLTSTVSHYLTERIETLMAQPNDLTYQRTGMLVGATLLAQTARWRAVTPAIHDNLVNFMENCMVDGANLGLLPLEDLGRAGDLPSFIAANVPQALAYYDVATGSTRACADGWPDILAAMGAEVTKVLTEKANAAYQGSNQFGGAANVARMTGTIQDFQNMMGMASANAANHLRHAMMVRALDDGITRFIATSGNDAAMSVYQAARAEAQTRASYSAVGMNATRWVPLLKITFEALYYAAFPLALILMFTPMAWTVIKGYFGGFVWLAAWNPLSAVLHSIVLKAGAGYYREGMSTTANGSTEYVMSWANHFGVQAVEQDVGVIAGYLMMSVPFLATALVFGAQRMSGLATSMLNVSQGAAIETGREAATGAMTLASTSFMMHNWNKLNTSPVTDTGRSSWVMPTGAVQTRNADGSVTYARGSALSDAGLQANASRTLQNELSQHRERAERQVATTGAELSQFIGQSASRYASAGEQLSASQSVGSESAMTSAGRSTSEARQAWSRIQDFSREHGLTVEETLRLAGAIEAGRANFGIGGNLSLAGNLTGRSGERLQELVRAARQSGLTETFASFRDSSDSLRTGDSESYGSTEAQGTRDSWDQGRQLADRHARALERAETLSEAERRIEARGAGFAQTLVDPILNAWRAQGYSEAEIERLANPRTGAELMAQDRALDQVLPTILEKLEVARPATGQVGSPPAELPVHESTLPPAGPLDRRGFDARREAAGEEIGAARQEADAGYETHRLGALRGSSEVQGHVQTGLDESLQDRMLDEVSEIPGNIGDGLMDLGAAAGGLLGGSPEPSPGSAGRAERRRGPAAEGDPSPSAEPPAPSPGSRGRNRGRVLPDDQTGDARGMLDPSAAPAAAEGRQGGAALWQASWAAPAGTMQEVRQLLAASAAERPSAQLLGLIDRTEGAGDYDTLFGHAQRPGGADGGRFDDVRVSQMTLGALKAFAGVGPGMSAYGRHVYGELAQSGQEPREATPMGRYQIVGTTLARLQGEMGLSDDTVFSPRVQDAMALRLIDRRLGAAATMEGKIAGLREEWEGFQGVQAGALASAIREYESGQGRAAPGGMASGVTGYRSPEVPRWLQAERDLHGIPDPGAGSLRPDYFDGMMTNTPRKGVDA